MSEWMPFLFSGMLGYLLGQSQYIRYVSLIKNVIIFAKHGFLFPEEKIPGPYNVTFEEPRTKSISLP